VNLYSASTPEKPLMWCIRGMVKTFWVSTY